MVYTVTLNASLDYIISVADFRWGYTNRTEEEQMLPGGKGINVSIVLHALGVPNEALGFIAGFVGEEIQKKVEQLDCQQNFIRLLDGQSRINIKMKFRDGTEINGQGPKISPHDFEKLLEQLEQLKDGDILVLAGSIPASLPDSVYRDIMHRLRNKKIMIAVDAAKDQLVNVLSYRPFLIKPNIHELGEIFHTEIHTDEELYRYGKKLQEMGAENVLISMGGDGAMLLAANGQRYRLAAPEGKLVNAVGAGDSMVAGFLAGWLEKQDYEYAFQLSVAAGSASAFSEQLATKPEVQQLLQQIQQAQKMEGRKTSRQQC